MALFTLNQQFGAIQKGGKLVTDKANIVAKDDVNNYDWRHGVGNKDDTPVGVIPSGTGLASIIAMLRGLVEAQGGYIAVVDNGSGSATSFGDASFSSFKNDHFNDNFVAMVFDSSLITEGTIRKITDFVSTNGVFTVDGMGANGTDGDIIFIYPRNLICEGESLPVRLGDIDTAAHTGAVDTATSIMAYCKQLVTAILAGALGGTEFTITKRLAKTDITFGAAVDLTGVSSGGVLTLKRVAIQNDANAGGGATGGVYIKSNDTNEPLNVALLGTGGALTANIFTGIDIGYQIASGKKIQIQAATSDVTGTDNVTLHLTFLRGVGGATIIAAA